MVSNICSCYYRKFSEFLTHSAFPVLCVIFIMSFFLKHTCMLELVRAFFAFTKNRCLPPAPKPPPCLDLVDDHLTVQV